MSIPLPAPRFSLSGLSFDEISLVRAGDDPRARVVLAKSAPDQDADRIDFTHLAKSGLPSLERSPGKDDNWIEQVGGHPAYIDKIARSLHYKRGMTISKAYQVAIGRVKDWAAGRGDVKPDTRAKAIEAWTEFEAKQAAWAALKASRAAVEKAAESDPAIAKALPTLTAEANLEDPNMLPETPADETATPATPDADAPVSPATPEVSDEVLDSLPEQALDYIASLEDEVDALRAALDAAQQAPEAAEVPEPVAKSEADVIAEAISKADPALREILEKAAAENAEAIAKAEAAEEERVQAEYIAKAADFTGLGESDESVAAVLRAIDALPESVAKAARTMLSAAAAQNESGAAALFEEVGKSDQESAVSGSFEAAVAEIKKSEGLSDLDARIALWERNHEFYTRAMNNEEI